MSRAGFRECQKCGRNRAERFYASNRGRICVTCRKKGRSKAAHENRVVATYGLQRGEYDQLFESQGGVCAICSQPRVQRLSVDHCHERGIVRGLLCRMCNGRLLTAARDRPEILRAAADYLESPPALEVLGERHYRGDPAKKPQPRKRPRRRKS
ncbi:endonuclease VII domain-containing protein [Spirillospora sp. NPDC047279]|uniref:endonuclease VII domain-containing protein n=1 Tax=Spirillospora sp. NPDC047279 TaxID=3155478 RepID=UPI00340678C9